MPPTPACRWTKHGDALRAEYGRKRHHLLFYSGAIHDIAPWDYRGRGGVYSHKHSPGFWVLRKGQDVGVDFSRAMPVSDGSMHEAVSHIMLSFTHA